MPCEWNRSAQRDELTRQRLASTNGVVQLDKQAVLCAESDRKHGTAAIANAGLRQRPRSPTRMSCRGSSMNGISKR